MVRLSIITPHYNMPKTLCRLSDSIHKKDWIEHIIVDDKSDIDPSALCEAKDHVLEKGARWIDNTTDKKGTGICRDLGIRNASGEWILIADSDDLFVEGAFDIIESHLDDKTDIIYFAPTSRKEGDVGKCNRHIPYERLVNRYVVSESTEAELRLRYLSVMDTSKLIRKDLIVKAGIESTNSVVANDVMFSVLCAFHADRIGAFEDVIYCIMDSPGTLTTTKDFSRFRKRIDVYIMQCRFLRENLPASSFNMIGLSASGMLLQCYNDYGILKTLQCLFILIRNRVPVDLIDLKTRFS